MVAVFRRYAAALRDKEACHDDRSDAFFCILCMEAASDGTITMATIEMTSDEFTRLSQQYPATFNHAHNKLQTRGLAA